MGKAVSSFSAARASRYPPLAFFLWLVRKSRALSRDMAASANAPPLRVCGGLGCQGHFCDAQHAALNPLNKYIIGTRATAAWALGRIGTDARTAVPWLRQSLSDTNGPMRLSAAIALWRIVQDTNVVALVIEQFDRNPHNTEALSALGEMGPLAKSAVPTLLKMLRSPDLSGIPA